MAISYVGNALGGTATTTSFSITLPTTQAGDIIILEFAHRGTGDGTIAGTSVSTGGLSWTLKHSQLFGASAFSGKTYWARATGDHSGQTVTGASLTNSSAAIVTVYRGAISSGDPLSDATIVGEQNLSGDATNAGITTTTSGAYVVLVVANSPDLAISGQTSTSPGALTERAELLSTGGTDTSISHASAAKATAGATGNLTWTQTAAANGSWAYAIMPSNDPPTVALNSPSDTVSTYYFDGSDAGALDTDNVWTNEANASDGSTSTYASTVSAGSTSTNEIIIQGTDAPASGGGITQVRARMYASAEGNQTGWTSYYTLTTPTGGWTWAKLQALETTVWRTAIGGPGGGVQGYAQIYTDGLSQSLGTISFAFEHVDTTWDLWVYRVEIEVTSSASDISTTPTLQFTGTDARGDEIEYNVQVDTNSGFNSQSGTPVVTDSYAVSNRSIALAYSTAIFGYGQTFLGAGGKLTSIKINVSTKPTTGTAYCRIYALSSQTQTTAIPTGTALQEITVDYSSITTGTTTLNATFNFDSTLTLSSGTYYAFTLEHDSSTGNVFGVGADNSSPSHGGTTIRKDNAGVWSNLSGLYDMPFEVIETPAAPLLNKLSATPDAGFSGTGDPHPWPSGNQVSYTIQSGNALTANTTYYWRVRGLDPSGSNSYGDWATSRSFTTASGGITTTRNQTGITRIAATTTRDQTGKGDIQVSVTRSQTGISRVQYTVPQLQAGASRVTLSVPRTQLGLSRIELAPAPPKNQTGVASIADSTITTTRAQTGAARVQVSVTRDQTGVSRITQTVPRTTTGISRVTQTVLQTQLGKAAVLLTVPRTQNGASRITASATKDQTGTARIATAVTKDQTGVSRISREITTTQTGTARIQTAVTQDQTGKGSLVYTVIAGQAGSSTLPPSSSVNNTGTGSVAWSNTGNATASDGAFANTGTLNDNMTGGNVIYDSHVKLIKGGTVQTTNKADTGTTWPTTFSTFNYGGSTDLWGTTWTATDINSSNFGVAFAAAGFRDPGYTYSNYLYVTGFGFSIPAGSTINGITASVIKRKQDPASNGTWVANVDYISVTVYYGGEMTGKASIAVAVDTSRDITGVSRIAQTASYTQTGISRITQTAPRTITGVSRITASASRTQSGLSRVSQTVPQVQTGVSRVTLTSTRDQTGRADVLNTTSQNVTGTSRITISSTKDQTGVSAIAKTVSRDQTGTSRVQVTTTRTQTGIADVIKAITQTITGLSRIAYTTTQLQTGAARITLVVPRTQTGISRITITTTRDQLGVARITLSVPRTQTGTARITATNLASVTGVTRIQITSSGNQTGLSRIQHIVLESQDGIARIALIGSRDQSGTARISLLPSQTQTGLARITNTSTQDITGTADVQRTFTVDQNGVARITTVGTQAQTGKGNVQNTTLQTQTGTSRLGGSIEQPQTGKSRVALITQQPQTGLSNVIGVTSRTQTGVARLGNQPLINLYDDFNDNSLDTAKWNSGAYSGASATETGERFLISIPASATASGELFTVGNYNLHESSISAQITITGTMTTNQTAMMQVLDSGYMYVASFWFNWSGSSSFIAYYDDGVTAGPVGSSIAYNATTHKYIRIRESASTLYWDTSPDGITWTNHASRSRTRDFSGAVVGFNANSGTASEPAWTMSVDNVNLTTYPRTQTGVSRVTNTATRDQTGKGRVTQTSTQTTTGTSRITNVVSRTQTGVSRITNTVARTQTGVASIVQSQSRDTTGLSRITQVIGQEQTGTGRLQNNVNQTQTGTGDVLRTVEQDISGTTLLAGLSLRDIDGRTSVSNEVLQTQRGQALVVRPYGSFDPETGMYIYEDEPLADSITAIDEPVTNVYDVSYNENGNFTPTQEDDTGSWETP